MGFLQSVSQGALALSILFGLLLGASFLRLTPNSDAYVIAVLTIIPITLLFIASVAVIYTGWDPI